jgi:hypothetical protein
MKRFGKGIALGAALVLCGGGVYAADQLLTGKKLLIKNPPSGVSKNKTVHLSKDPGITIDPSGGDGDPTCGGGGGGGGSITIATSGAAGDITIPLPCANWSTNGANNQYKYKDTTKATCTTVLVKPGKLAKAVCQGTQVAIDLQAGMDPVAVAIRLGQDRYCTSFGGTIKKDGSDDKTFLALDALAAGGCPASPSGAFLDASGIL